jgi:TRAP transporter TAXI family solute receptor
MAEDPKPTAQATRPRHPLRALLRTSSDGGPRRFDKSALKDLVALIGLPLLAVIAAFWLAARFVQPAPPQYFVMATGPDGGAYHLFAQRYRDIVKRKNITITLKPSAGSIENLQRLQDDKSEFAVALIQAGVVSGAAPAALRSLGAVYYEPLWLFYRGAENIEKLSQLAGRRVAIGPDGSGTRALALQLLKASGVDPSAPELVPFGGSEAVKALLDEDVEAVMLVAAPDAPTVRQLANAKEIKLASLAQAEALTRRFPFLTALQLPRGAIDLASDLPARDVTLLATTANLIVKKDFHPALGVLLLQAASEVHSGAGVLQKAGEFPAPRESGIPMADEAKQYFKSGPPFLQRYLPFWLANLIERLAVLLLPLIAVVLPLFKVLPVVIQWRNKSRVFKWYGELKFLEAQVAKNTNPAELERYLARLDEIEDGVNQTRIGASYTDYIYNLRLHIELVRNRLHRLVEQRT